MATDLFLVEANPALISRFAAGCERAGYSFRVRTVLPGPVPARGTEEEDDGQVAPLLLRLERTAEALDCSPTTVKRLIKAGELPAVKVHGATRIRVADLQAYVEQLAGRTYDSNSEGVSST